MEINLAERVKELEEANDSLGSKNIRIWGFISTIIEHIHKDEVPDSFLLSLVDDIEWWKLKAQVTYK